MKRRNKIIESPPDDIPEIIGGDWRSRILTFAKCVKELDEAQKDDEDEDEGGTGHGRNGDDVIREAASIVEQSAYWYQRTFLSGVNQDDPTLNTGLDKGALQQ